ncbi:PilN domain-containing protein [Persephonella sp.]
MIKINLNPEKVRKKIERKKIGLEALKTKTVIYIGIPVILIASELLYLTYLNYNVSKLKEKREQLMAERAKYKDIEQEIRKLKKKVAEAEKLKEETKLKMAIFEKLSSEKTDFIPMISSIAVSMPDGIWLNRLSITRSSSSLSGFTFNPKFISEFYNNLSKYYTNVKFKSTARERGGNLSYYSFSFNMGKWEVSDKNKKGKSKKD